MVSFVNLRFENRGQINILSNITDTRGNLDRERGNASDKFSIALEELLESILQVPFRGPFYQMTMCQHPVRLSEGFVGSHHNEDILCYWCHSTQKLQESVALPSPNRVQAISERTRVPWCENEKP